MYFYSIDFEAADFITIQVSAQLWRKSNCLRIVGGYSFVGVCWLDPIGEIICSAK